MIELKDVTKRIGRKTIVDSLNFSIGRGEIFGLLGPNGAGKTTTIRMMVGLIRLSKGDVLIRGYSIQRDYRRAIAEIGAIVETPAFYSYMSGYQNLLHYANMYANVDRVRIDEVVQFVGLSDRILDSVQTYSLGMRQRLGIAQALLHRPSVLILDEPTNGLDPAGIKELREYLRRLAEERGVAIIVSSHLLSEMEMMCDRTAIIKGGKLLAVRKIGERATQASVAFTVDNPEGAVKALNGFVPEIIASFENGYYLEVQLRREQIPVIVKFLAGAGFGIYEVQPKTKSLEEIFMEVTTDE